MKNLLILVLIVSFNVSSFGQESKWTIGFFGSPYFYKIKSMKGLNHDINSKFSYQTGIESAYLFSKRSEIQLGLSFSNISYNVNYDFSHASSEISLPKFAEIKAQYIDISLFYDINFITNEKCKFYLIAGPVSSFLISSQNKTTFQNNNVGDAKDLTANLFSLQAGIGIKYKLNNKLSLKFEPQFRYHFKVISFFTGYNPTSINCSLGIIYLFPEK
ncbi:MAG: PorT family protein [Bacteroidia bacterium]|nr:PorT family protein [Bacteroidia bacterium]